MIGKKQDGYMTYFFKQRKWLRSPGLPMSYKDVKHKPLISANFHNKAIFLFSVTETLGIESVVMDLKTAKWT